MAIEDGFAKKISTTDIVTGIEVMEVDGNETETEVLPGDHPTTINKSD